MPRIPFIGRLNVSEYLALVVSFFLVGAEAFIRIITLALPTTILRLFYRASRRLFNRFTSPIEQKPTARKKKNFTSIGNASDFPDLCNLFGYYAEEHVVQTKDGYLLGLHRLGWRKGEEDIRVNSRDGDSLKKKVVYLHHGLLMNSEVWVCLTDEERCLPFRLVEKGYDVWLGNNRGNKYSKKCINSPPTSMSFWNFSMDEFAIYDIPDSIHYIMETTLATSISYIGFSQGTAQAFATLAVHPTLNDKVDVFIALAPAMSPAGLSNGIVDSLMKASPQVLYLLFGRRSLLSSATMWQSILYPPIFVRLIDISLSFLFGWQTKNISSSQKLAAYPHLYSFTSTKSVVHWFQIIRNKSFQMYDDDVHPLLSIASVSKYTKVARFPTRNIKTPVVLVYGGSDSLVDISVMLKELPGHTVATEIPHYEHLDFLWARDIEILVFPHVFNALESFTNGGRTKENYEKYKVARTVPMSTCILPPAYDCEDEGSTIGSFAFAPIEPPRQGFDAAVISRAQDGPCDKASTRPPLLHEQAKAEMQQIEEYRASSSSTPDRGNSHTVRASEPPDCDEEAPPSSAEYRLRNKRNASIGSFEAPSLLKRGGIRLGVGKVANSVVSRGVEELGPNSRNSSDTDTALERNGGGKTGKVRRTRDRLTSC